MVIGATFFLREFLPHLKDLGVLPLVKIDPETPELDIRFQGLIRATGKVFSTVSTVTIYIDTFIFKEERLQTQIETIEHFKTMIASKTTSFASLAFKFLEDGLWRESNMTKEQL